MILRPRNDRRPERGRPRGGWCLLPLVLGTLWASAAETGPSEYRRRLRDAAQGLRTAAERPKSPDAKKSLNEVRERLPVSQTVENQGAVARADYTWLYDTLHAVETDIPPDQKKASLVRAAERLEAIARQVKDTTATGPSGDGARQELQKILRRTEFTVAESGEDTGRLAHWLRRALERLWLKLFGGRSRPTQWPIIEVLFVVALAALLALMVSHIRSAWYRPPSLTAERARSPAAAPTAAGPLSALMAQALRYADEGNYRWAIRFLYLALLAALSERAWIRLDERKTNREYLSEVKAKATDPALMGPLARMTESFDRVWYGEQVCTEQQYREYFEYYRSVEKTMGDLRAAG